MKNQSQSHKNILVLGSKKGLKLPKSRIFKVYAANGAISLISKLKKAKNFELNCVTAAVIYLRHKEIRKKILNSKPNRFVIKGNLNIQDVKKDFNHKFKYKKFDNNVEINFFQSKFFKKSKLSLFFSEYFYEKNFIKKIIHFIKILFNFKKNIGVSTGFFSLLLALDENKKSNIIISGISMQEGSHFFKKKRLFIKRARVDLYLFKNLKKNFKERLYTTDKHQSLDLNIKYFKE